MPCKEEVEKSPGITPLHSPFTPLTALTDGLLVQQLNHVLKGTQFQHVLERVHKKSCNWTLNSDCTQCIPSHVDNDICKIENRKYQYNPSVLAKEIPIFKFTLRWVSKQIPV